MEQSNQIGLSKDSQPKNNEMDALATRSATCSLAWKKRFLTLVIEELLVGHENVSVIIPLGAHAPISALQPLFELKLI